jgi:hypothetical protein
MKSKKPGKTTVKISAKKTNLTNTELIVEMMEYSNFGALSQLFIMEAIRKEAERVAATKPEQYDVEKWFMISVPAWIGVAKEISKRIKTR